MPVSSTHFSILQQPKALGSTKLNTTGRNIKPFITPTSTTKKNGRKKYFTTNSKGLKPRSNIANTVDMPPSNTGGISRALNRGLYLYYILINHEKLYLNTFKKNKHTYIVLVFRKKYTGSKQKWDKTGSK